MENFDANFDNNYKNNSEYYYESGLNNLNQESFSTISLNSRR